MWTRVAASYTRIPKSFLANFHLRLTTGNTSTPSRSLSTTNGNSKQLEYAWSQWARLQSFLGTGQVCFCHARISAHVLTFRTPSFHPGLRDRWGQRHGDPETRGKAGRNFLKVTRMQRHTIKYHFLKISPLCTVGLQHYNGPTCAKKCIWAT